MITLCFCFPTIWTSHILIFQNENFIYLLCGIWISTSAIGGDQGHDYCGLFAWGEAHFKVHFLNGCVLNMPIHTSSVIVCVCDRQSVVFDTVSAPPESSTTCAAHMGTSLLFNTVFKSQHLIAWIKFMNHIIGWGGGSVPERLCSRLEEQEEQEQGKFIHIGISEQSCQSLTYLFTGTEVWSEAPRWGAPRAWGKEGKEINLLPQF